MGGIRLGKILGFEIRLDWSWMFIFFLVVYTLAVGWFPDVYKRQLQECVRSIVL